MESERARIQKLLEDGKITEADARKLLKALEEREESSRRKGAPAKRRTILYLLITGLVAASLVLAFLFLKEKGGVSKNLLLNPGFESGAGGRVSSWTPSEAGAAFLGGRNRDEALFIRDDKVYHSGRFSVSIRNDKGERTLSWRQQLKTFPKGKKLRLTGYIRSEGVEVSGSASLVIRGLKGLKEETFSAASSMSYDLTGSKDWTPVKVQALVTEDTEEVQILCQLEGAGRIWCDDIDLRVVD